MTPRSKKTDRAAGVLLVGTLLSIGLTPPAQANTTTYFYKGSDFNIFGGNDSCPPECHLSGWFTVSTLAGGLTNASITPASFQFTDGFATLTTTNTSVLFGTSSFLITTNASGQITAWDVYLTGPTVAHMESYNGPGTPYDETWDAPLYANYAEVEYTSGSRTWRTSISPEPSALLLFSVGFISLGMVSIFRTRRRCGAIGPGNSIRRRTCA